MKFRNKKETLKGLIGWLLDKDLLSARWTWTFGGVFLRDSSPYLREFWR